jgi:hypothetical protein
LIFGNFQVPETNDKKSNCTMENLEKQPKPNWNLL